VKCNVPSVYRASYRVAFKNRSLRYGTAHALLEGQGYADTFNDAFTTFTTAERARMSLVRWLDVHDEQYKAMVNASYAFYQTNAEFAARVDDVVGAFILHRLPMSSVPFPAKRRQAVMDYVLHELPSFCAGIRYHGLAYQDLVYPSVRVASTEPQDKLTVTRSATLLHARMHALTSTVRHGSCCKLLRSALGINNDSDFVHYVDIDVPAEISHQTPRTSCPLSFCVVRAVRSAFGGVLLELCVH
jgi:hypothetical protein